MRRAARFLVLSASNRPIHCADGPDGWTNTGQGGTTHGGAEFASPLEDVARRLDEIGGDMPERAARWIFLQAREHLWKPLHPDGSTGGFRPESHPSSWGDVASRGAVARRLDDMTGAPMSTRPPYDLIVELCAGTAALSWALAGLRFPVSRMGSKAGYSWSILSALGLSVGDMPRRFLWIEPDEELARTLALLTTPGGAAAVAAVIRSWIPCPNGHDEGGEAWCLECATWRNESERDGAPVDGFALKLDEARIERKRNGTIRRWASGPSTGKQDARRLWERLRKERPEASPEREGRFLAFHGLSNSFPIADVGGELCNVGGGGTTFGDRDTKTGPKPPALGARLDSLAPLPATVVCGRAEDIEPPEDCSRVLVYMDPNYQGTTGYAHSFPRPAVVAVARRWAEAGAHVVLSEAEPIPELIADGWHFCDIADARIGQRRTFSRQQREVLTSNRPLRGRHAWPARDALPGQGGLFG